MLNIYFLKCSRCSGSNIIVLLILYNFLKDVNGDNDGGTRKRITKKGNFDSLINVIVKGIYGFEFNQV